MGYKCSHCGQFGTPEALCNCDGAVLFRAEKRLADEAKGFRRAEEIYRNRTWRQYCTGAAIGMAIGAAAVVLWQVCF